MKALNNHSERIKLTAILCFTLLFFESCKFNDDGIYVISREDSIIKNSHYNKSGILLMAPRIISGTFNFIIDESDQCYFYSYQQNKITGLSNDNIELEKPLFLNLLPNHLFKIPIDYSKEFIDQNVFTEPSKYRTKVIVVSSYKDTVRSNIVLYLRQLEKDTANHVVLYIRRAINEERVVLKYKKEDKYYDPKNGLGVKR